MREAEGSRPSIVYEFYGPAGQKAPKEATKEDEADPARYLGVPGIWWPKTTLDQKNRWTCYLYLDAAEAENGNFFPIVGVPHKFLGSVAGVTLLKDKREFHS